MGIAKMVFYVVGGLVIIIGLAMLFFASGLDAWIPGSIVVAGLVILVGLLVMGLSNRAPKEERVTEVHHHEDRHH